ncbi:MAG: helix-turn-helix transcriptional regulator [Calditrichaeota bacterium]|nr:helix-turn-helix transcriptional regulator [Calditrichota bacterium]
MENLLIIFSLIGVLNSLVLIVYFFTTKKGIKIRNRLFAFLILSLTVRISKSILFFVFGNSVYDLILVVGLAGFLLAGPLMWLFTKSVADKNYRFKKIELLHFIPAALFIIIFNIFSYAELAFPLRNFVYNSILLQYIIYIIIALKRIQRFKAEFAYIEKQMNYITLVLLLIWFAYMLNAATGYFHYLNAALIYSGIVYFSLILIINKGEIINFKPVKKYEKTGLSKQENLRLKTELDRLMNREQMFKDSMISLAVLAKQLRVSTNILSQVINVNYNKSFFEFLSHHRINLAKSLLSDPARKDNISEIAFEVGYNSLSAFNTAFKKATGCTPSQYKKRFNNDN